MCLPPVPVSDGWEASSLLDLMRVCCMQLFHPVTLPCFLFECQQQKDRIYRHFPWCPITAHAEEALLLLAIPHTASV